MMRLCIVGGCSATALGPILIYVISQPHDSVGRNAKPYGRPEELIVRQVRLVPEVYTAEAAAQ